MPIAVLTSKGQMTIPKQVRKSLHLKPLDKIVITLEGDQAVLKPLRGTILDIGGTIKTSGRISGSKSISEKPSAYRKIRDEVRKQVGRKAVERGSIK